MEGHNTTAVGRSGAIDELASVTALESGSQEVAREVERLEVSDGGRGCGDEGGHGHGENEGV